MSNLKKSCAHDLSFPYHDDGSADVRLQKLADFMRANELEAEYFVSGAAVDELQERVAGLFGKEAAAWCPTGVMAQAIAARIHLADADSREILLHPTSHLLLHEEEGYLWAHNLKARVCGEWDRTLSSDDIAQGAGCAFVELPQRHNGGLLPTWNELSELAATAQQTNTLLHLDGARIWTCRPFYDNRSYAEIVCPFDSIYVSLYKGIGALGGAMLVGDRSFIDEAIVWRTRLGGMLAGAWPFVCDALRLFDKRLEQCVDFVNHAKALAEAVTQVSDANVQPATPHTNMFHIEIPHAADVCLKARDLVAKKHGIWLADKFWHYSGDGTSTLEIMIGESALAVEPDQFAAVVEVLCAAANRQ